MGVTADLAARSHGDGPGETHGNSPYVPQPQHTTRAPMNPAIRGVHGGQQRLARMAHGCCLDTHDTDQLAHGICRLLQRGALALRQIELDDLLDALRAKLRGDTDEETIDAILAL